MLSSGAWPKNSDGLNIEEARLVEKLSSPPVWEYDWFRVDRPGGECRGVTWSSDGQWFGWSCGHRVVRIVRWNSEKNHSIPTDNDSNSSSSNSSNSSSSSSSSSTDTEEPLVSTTVTDTEAPLVSTTVTDTEAPLVSTTVTEINTGDYVWSLAFGTKRSTPGRKGEGNRGEGGRSIWGGNVVTSGQSSICRKDLIPGEVVLATGQANGRIRVWDIQTGQLKFELCDHVGRIESLHFATTGTLRLASVSGDGSMKVWDLDESGNLQRTIKSPRGLFRDCKWSPDSLKLVTVGDLKHVCVWDTVTYELLMKLEGHQHNVCRCDFSPDGAVLATCSYDTRVIIWDSTTGRQLLELNHCQPAPSLMYAGGANGMYVRGLSFSPDGQYISTVCDDGYMRVWEVCRPDTPVLVSRVRNALVVQYSSNGTAISVGTTKGCVSIWKAPLTVSTLQHLCRAAIRQCLKDSTVIDRLNMTTPPALRRYLSYIKDWRCSIE